LTVLGIDPGIAFTGYGIVEQDRVGDVHYIDSGVISTSSKKAETERLNEIYVQVSRIIEKYRPDVVAIETIYFTRNLRSLAQVSEAIGVISLAAGRFGLEVRKFTPLEVKSAVARSGKADKSQIQLMVKQLLGLTDLPRSNHASDALAIAICYNTNAC
jgi:crossover junction endodeoxyribonuclease RuvC